MRKKSYTVCLLMCFAVCTVSAKENMSYHLKEGVVYTKDHGVGYIMDIYTPTEKPNGLAIVHTMNGGWYSHDGLVGHFTKDLRTFDNLCSRGYTVFSVWTGSQTRFTCEDMIGKLQTAIRWVKAHAVQYKINPDKLGITGASAGGQLALMAVINDKDYDLDGTKALKQYNTTVAAIGLMFPGTDLTKSPETTKEEYSKSRCKLFFRDGLERHSYQEIHAKAMELSPVYHVHADMPPVFVAQGDKDFFYKKTLRFVEAVRSKNVNAELVIVEGAGHNWPTMYVETKKMAKWFDSTLLQTKKTTEHIN